MTVACATVDRVPGMERPVAEVGGRLKVSTEKIPDSQVLMTIEVEPERLQHARDKALRKLSPRAKVPGFRPGKAPPHLVRQYFGEERILDEALDALVPDVYREAVESDESIDPIARPRLVIETTEPLVVKATIPVRPTVELGDYAAVRVPVEEITVDEARVEETLTLIRRRTATLEPVERELRWDDIARIDVRAVVGDEPIVRQQEVEVRLAGDRDVLFPGFEEALLAHTKGETLEFDLPVPETITDEKFAGKDAHFTVTIAETKEEILPDLDDDFAKQVGDGFDTVADLRDRVRADIRAHQEEQLNDRYHDQILEQLVAGATIEFPPILVEHEIDHLLEDRAGRLGRDGDVEAYLRAIGKTEEEVRDELRPIADVRLRRSLVLGQVVEAEQIAVTDDELAAEIGRLTAGPQAGQLRQAFESPDVRASVRRDLLTRKTLTRLVEIATQDGAAPPSAADEPETAHEPPAAESATEQE